jgi:hypothetical protein
MKRSQNSGCHIEGAGSPDWRTIRPIALAVNVFHEPTTVFMLHPSRVWNSAWTWLGITTQAIIR